MFSFPKPETWKYIPLFEKLGYYKQHLDHRYVPYVDKLQVKQIVKDMCPGIKVANVVRILSGPDDLTYNDLRTDCIIKSTHGCGWNIQSDTQLETCKHLLNSWNRNYAGADEPQYKLITPRFFIEEKVNDIRFGQNGEALLYRFHCIQGKPVVASVSNNVLQSNYDMKWNKIEASIISPDLPYNVEKPECYDTLVEYAKILSAPFEFVRIDFYLGVDGIYFSEFTFSPAGGNRRFSFALERKYGAMWK
jgi:hypothetical protein